MDAHTKSILMKFGTTVFSQAILNKDAQQLTYIVKKFALQVPSSKEANANAAAALAEQFKK